jgi:hypothetical protein
MGNDVLEFLFGQQCAYYLDRPVGQPIIGIKCLGLSQINHRCPQIICQIKKYFFEPIALGLAKQYHGSVRAQLVVEKDSLVSYMCAQYEFLVGQCIVGWQGAI